MRCEAHVRFLGGGGAVMRCRYPTQISINLVVVQCSLVRHGSSTGLWDTKPVE